MAANVLFLPFIRIHSPSSLFIQFNFYLPACDVPFLSFYLSVCLSVCMSVSLSACLFALPVTCPPLLLLGDEVLALKLRCCDGRLYSFPMGSSPTISRFAASDVKGGQVATGNGASCPWQQHNLKLKPGHQTTIAPYATDNRRTVLREQKCMKATYHTYLLSAFRVRLLVSKVTHNKSQ